LAVFTPVSEEQLSRWLGQYAVGDSVTLEPIASGIENTNYFVDTRQGRYVLTLFERLGAAELPFYLDLMGHLARHGIPCPAPIIDLSGRNHSLLNGKPAALVTRLRGGSIDRPDADACAQLGGLLGRMHLAGRSFGGYLDNPRGAAWRRDAARGVSGFLDESDRALLQRELAEQESERYPDLPRGPIHADLFRDNALFDDARLSGVIDFYFAGIDCLLLDVAVCANDWCLVDPASDRRFDGARLTALLAAYAAVRSFESAERVAWQSMQRLAALRFWLSRLFDLHRPRSGVLVHAHDPDHFRNILALRSSEPTRELP
jgi:homoserine kinase type II